MKHELSIAAAIASVAIAGALLLLIPAFSFAEPVHKNVHVNKNVNVNRNAHANRNVNVNKNVHVNRNANVNRNVHVNRNYVVGRAYNGHYWYGRNRHFWHGRWYAYGVGECWINVDGLWFWNVAICPP